MFITWRIWRILRYPLRQNPVYRWVWNENRPRPSHPPLQPHLIVRSALVLVGVGMMLLLMPFALVAALMLLLLLPALLLLLNGTALGLYWVATITDTLSHHRHGGRSVLLGTTPRGTLGISWLMATVCIHRNDILRTAYRVLRWVIGIVLTMLVMALVVILVQLLDPPLYSGQVTLLMDLITIMALVVAAWFDHIQSIVVAALIGILAPTYSTRQPLVRVSAIGAYLIVQVLFYAVMLLLFTQIQLLAFNLLAGDVSRRLVVTGLGLGMFYVLREGVIRVLWWLMLRRYQSTPAEFKEVMA